MNIKLFCSIIFTIWLILSAGLSFAHYDTKDGPLIADAIKAIEQNNVNYVLKWVHSADEKEVKEAFVKTMKVRVLSSDAETLADLYFFETSVRIHRSGEGVPYTGVKPSGTPIDENILAADKAIKLGDLSPFGDLVSQEKYPENCLTKQCC